MKGTKKMKVAPKLPLFSYQGSLYRGNKHKNYAIANYIGDNAVLYACVFGSTPTFNEIRKVLRRGLLNSGLLSMSRAEFNEKYTFECVVKITEEEYDDDDF